MNDIQLYNLYLSYPLPTIFNRQSKIYPKYVVHMGRAFAGPNPCRHYSFQEFLDKLESDESFKDMLIN